jgi:hypothetical protein
MSGADSNGRHEGASAPSVVHRRTPEELRALPPVRTRPVKFTGCGLGPYGRWRPGDPVGKQEKPTKTAEEALLDWALVSWARRHVVEEEWDYRGAP